MASLSAVMIVKDEARGLEPALAALDWADEIVVVDAGSRDDTVAIARRHTDRVFVESDWQGYGIQRRRAQARASGDWLLWIDADEIVTPALADEIRAAVARDDRTVAFELPRLSWVFGRFIRHGGWYPDPVLRLYPAGRGRYSDALVHEHVELAPGMQVERLREPLLHYTYRDMQHYLVKSAAYARAWADTRERQGRSASLLQGLLHGSGCFLRMYVLRAGFLDGPQGLLLALLSAHSTFVKYADLWTRRQPRPLDEQSAERKDE